MINKEKNEASRLFEDARILLESDIENIIKNGQKLEFPKNCNVYVLKKDSDRLTSLIEVIDDIKLSTLQYPKLEKYNSFIRNGKEKEIFTTEKSNHLYHLVSWTELEVEYLILEKPRTSFDNIFLNHK
ncbi:hypothetical protein [Saccharicrinis aurantiacus]|uniref:hypothetical protein n=1 Tax=Saccharicrinis aurantiacus TaxID=1849719 RepID=UPI002492C6A9|nr:hypothetical protein [Saccharicrinis aurantiacus]